MIEKQEEKIFREWSQVRKSFCPDGVIDEQTYLESNPKLLFLMKEVNGKKGESLDLKEFIRNGARTQTWDNIARWVYGIRHLDREIEWSELEKINSPEKRVANLRSICVINLKKSSGANVTDNNDLYNIANEDKAFFTRQFDLYEPDLIIACGSAVTNTFLGIMGIDDPKWLQTIRGIWYFRLNDKTTFISYSHPEARIQDSLLYYGLIDAVKEIYKPK